MAAKGFTGVNPIFADGPGPELIGGLGKDWLILDLYHKPYACCFWVHPPIAGALALIKDHGLAPEQITRIRVHSFREAIQLSCAAPRDTEEAQYNLAYGLACAILKGKLGPREVTPPTISDPQILAFMAKIEPVEDPEIQKGYPDKRQARVQITTTEGRVFDSGVVDARWGVAADRPTDQDLIEKFQMVTEPVLGRNSARALQELAWNLEQAPKASRLVDLATAKSR